MSMHATPSADVLRFPPRLRVVPDSVPLLDPRGTSALDALLSVGTLDVRQHAAALAYTRLRRRYDRSGGPMRSWHDKLGRPAYTNKRQ